MAILKKEDTIFKKNGEELSPIKRKVVLPINDEYPEVEFKPITRKEYREMLKDIQKTEDGKSKTSDDLDRKIVLEKYTSPQYTEEDIDCIPMDIFNVLISTIMEYSGITDGSLRSKIENDGEGQ